MCAALAAMALRAVTSLSRSPSPDGRSRTPVRRPHVLEPVSVLSPRSRGSPRTQGQMPAGVPPRYVLQNEACVCIEIFAGTARLTKALRQQGLTTEPFDIAMGHDMLRRELVLKLKDMIQHGSVKYVHFAPPCSSYSPARWSHECQFVFNPVHVIAYSSTCALAKAHLMGCEA